MSKNPKMVICRNCNNAISQKAKICPSCGAKNKKPFYKKAWFIIFAIIVVIGVIGSIGGNNDGNKENEVDNTENAPVEETGSHDNENVKDSVQESTPQEEQSSEEATSSADDSQGLVDGMRPEFKEAMDSYEAFYDEYCDFMKKYAENPSDLKLIAEYANMVSKLDEMNKKFAAWDEEEMNDTELKYYLEVNTRVTQKLLEVAE